MKRNKIALIGGGQIGGILALICAQKELGDIIIVDIPKAEGMVKGKALDILESNPHDGYDVNITGSSKLSDIKNADVVAITAGVPRKPGMSREDLLEININIISEIAINVKKYSPNAFVIVVSNPLDAIVYAFHKISGLPKNKVVGMAGALDNARFKAFIAMETGLSVQDGHRIVEIGCIEIDNFVRTNKKFHYYLNPQRKVSESALKVHGYTDEFLSDKNIFKDIADDFLKFIEGKKIIIHNAEFDIGHLNNELSLIKKEKLLEIIFLEPEY